MASGPRSTFFDHSMIWSFKAIAYRQWFAYPSKPLVCISVSQLTFLLATAATVVAGIFETMQSCHHVRTFLYSKWGSEERSFVSQMSLSLNHSLSVLLCLPVLTQLHTVERICLCWKILCFLSKYQGIKIIQCNSGSPICLNLPHILQRLLLQRHSSTQTYNNSEYVWQIQADRGITTALYDFYAMRKHSVF